MAKSKSVRKKPNKQKISKNTLRRRELSKDLSEFIDNIANMQKELSNANAVSRNFIIGLCTSVRRELPYSDLIFGQAAEQMKIDDPSVIDELKYQIFAFNTTRNEHILNFNRIIEEVGNPLVELRKLLDDNQKWDEMKKAQGKEAVAVELDIIDVHVSNALINAQHLFAPTLGFGESLIVFKEKITELVPEGYIDWMEGEYRKYCNRLRNNEEGLTRLTDIEKALEDILVKEWKENKEVYSERLKKEQEEAQKETETEDAQEVQSTNNNEELDTPNEAGGEDDK